MSYEIEIKLQQLMEEYNLSQRQAAVKIGISQRTISELANNKMKQLPISALEKIAEAFTLEDIQDLIDFKKDK